MPRSRGETFSVIFSEDLASRSQQPRAEFSLHSVPASWGLKAKRNTSICRQKALSQAVEDIQGSSDPLLRAG